MIDKWEKQLSQPSQITKDEPIGIIQGRVVGEIFSPLQKSCCLGDILTNLSNQNSSFLPNWGAALPFLPITTYSETQNSINLRIICSGFFTYKNRWETTNSKTSGPIIMIGRSETGSSSQIIFITLLWQMLDFVVAFTSLSNLCKSGMKQSQNTAVWLSEIVLECFDFPSSNFNL
jgi:hypothetical protein